MSNIINNFKPGLKNEEEQLNIEKGVLASILLGSDISQEISPVMFHSQCNQIIINALIELKKTSALDWHILYSHLQKIGELEKAGGIAYITELTNYLPSSHNITYYANELADSYYRRSVNSILSLAQEELINEEPLDEIIERVPQNIHEISLRRNDKKGNFNKGISFSDLVKKQFPSTVWMVENLITIGLTLLIGGSKIGKSWLALQLATAIDKGDRFLGNLSTQKMGIIYFALEDTEERIQNRLIKLGADEFNDAWLATTWKRSPTFLKTFFTGKSSIQSRHYRYPAKVCTHKRP